MFRHAICLVAFAIAASCLAQVPLVHRSSSSSEVFGGFSLSPRDYAHNQDNNFTGVMPGWEASYRHGVLPWLGLTVDGSGYYRSDPGGIHPHTYFFLAGPEISERLGRHRVFARALLGGAHMNSGYQETFPLRSVFTFAVAVGGGIDTMLAPRIAWRVNIDYLHTNFTPGDGEQNQLHDLVASNVRISTGVLLRF